MCDIDNIKLPPRPREPLDSECCGTGCTPCVLDLYEQDLKLWEEECDRILNVTDDSVTGVEILATDVYTEFELIDISVEAQDCVRCVFKIPNNQSIPATVGQHLVLRNRNGDASVCRQYTPISDYRHRGSFELVIKLYENGEMSKYIRQWKKGDLIEWRGPFGNYSYTPNSCKRIVMLSAGTGVAPMIQIIRNVLSNENDDTRIHLVCAFSHYRDILCRKLIHEWSDFWNFHCTYFLSQETEDELKRVKTYGDSVILSRLTEDHLEELVGNIADTKFLVCGTKSFDKDMLNYLHRLGVQEELIFKF